MSEITFSPLQAGALAIRPAPIALGETNETALTVFRSNPGLEAVPIMRDGKIIGVIPALNMLETFDDVSARMRSWLRELHLFVIPPRARLF